MNDAEEQLLARGYDPAEVQFIIDLMDDQSRPAALTCASELLHRIFIRVGRDSPAGCALRRALGFSGDLSFNRAAKDFCISKQHMHALQRDLEAKLGELSFIARAQRDAAKSAAAGRASSQTVENKDNV